jgi:hypothetical protein
MTHAFDAERNPDMDKPVLAIKTLGTSPVRVSMMKNQDLVVN